MFRDVEPMGLSYAKEPFDIRERTPGRVATLA